MQQLLSTVLGFDLTTYKLGKNNFTPTDLAGLKDCSNLLLYEMGMECVATGLDVSVEASLCLLPSSHSNFCHMPTQLKEMLQDRNSIF